MSTPTDNAAGQEGLSFAAAMRDSLVCGVIWLHADRKSATLTREAAQLLGLDPEQGSQIALTALPEPLHDLARKRLSDPTPVIQCELELSQPGRPPLYFRASAFRVQTGAANPGGVLVLSNLTPARRLQPHLAQLDRLANTGVLAASMAHEIKNALVAGKTFVDLLLEKNQDAELVGIVRRELGRIDAIVTRMLRFAGPARPGRAPVSLHEVLDHSLALVEHQAAAKHLTLKCSCSASPHLVQGDEYELQQAFVNLLLNALDAVGAEGTLSVATENLSPEAAAALVPKLPTGRYLQLSIHDTGVGIPAENLGRLFEPFFTTKPSGTGLGLPITQRIVQDHHGAILVESHPGQGSTFRVLLPAL